METRLSVEDIVIVIVYFLLIIAVGIYASCKAARGTMSGYFLAGRNMWFFMVGASLFVSNIGSEHFIGLAGSGSAGGIGVGAWEFNAILLLQLLGFVFVPVYIACQTYTMPEYLRKRFGGQRIRVYFACLSLILYIFTKCSVDLYTGALFIQQSLGWDLYLSIFILIVIVAILTITGGLTAVIYTDTVQATLMIGGAIALMSKGFYDLGGFDGLWARYPYAVTNETVPNTTCHEVDPHWNIMLREPTDTVMPWPGFLLGQTPGSIWYWCTDQVIVQRALAAKSLSHAQGATIMAAILKILPLFIMVMPGMMARVFYPNEVACVDPQRCYEICQSYAGCSNIAYPKLVLGIMPVGARGLMMAVMIAALMSDLDSIFNSASTLFTIDIYKRIRKHASVKELLIVGRIFIVVMTGVAIAWVPVVKETQGGQVFIYIQEVTNYLAPPVACVFLIAILWPRCNEQGAFWGLMAGFVTGVIRLVLVFVYPAPDRCGDPDTRPAMIKDFQYMYFATLLFWVTFIVTVVVSMLTKPPPYKFLYRTTFWTRYDKVEKLSIDTGKVQSAWDNTTCCYSIRTTTETQTYDNPALALDDPDTTVVVGRRVSLGTQCDLGGDGAAVHGGTSRQGVYTVMDGQMEVEEGQDEGKGGGEDKKSCEEVMMNYFCGVAAGGLQNEDDERKAREHEDMLSSLEQSPGAKLGLNVMMVTILLVGTALYIFWSLWGYEVPMSDKYNTTLVVNG